MLVTLSQFPPLVVEAVAVKESGAELLTASWTSEGKERRSWYEKVIGEGVTEIVPLARSWFTVNVSEGPAAGVMVMMPVRGAPVGFRAAAQFMTASAVPDVAEVSVSQSALLEVVHCKVELLVEN